MPFAIGGYSPTNGRCGCCQPPCTWNLSILPVPAGGSTVRFQGPPGSGIDDTVTLACSATAATKTNPAAGTWTITISRPCFTTQTFTVDVEQCKSISRIVELAFSYPYAHYSDDVGSCTVALSRSAYPPAGHGPGTYYTGWGSYSFSSGHTAQCKPCGPYSKSQYLMDQTATVPVRVEIAVVSNCDGSLLIGVNRYTKLFWGAQDRCASDSTDYYVNVLKYWQFDATTPVSCDDIESFCQGYSTNVWHHLEGATSCPGPNLTGELAYTQPLGGSVAIPASEITPTATITLDAAP